MLIKTSSSHAKPFKSPSPGRDDRANSRPPDATNGAHVPLETLQIQSQQMLSTRPPDMIQQGFTFCAGKIQLCYMKLYAAVLRICEPGRFEARKPLHRAML